MYEDLIKRLRTHNGWALNKTLDEAADAIEQLSNAWSAYGRGWTLGYDAGREESKPRECEFAKPKTNADRIRAMSNEEFSHFLFGIQCAPASRPKEWLDWLQQEAES